jgi:hypothetical protein
MYAITRFRSLTDVHGELVQLGSFEQFVRRFHVATDKQQLPGWSAATFEGHCRGKPVLSVCALVLDHDDGMTYDAIAHHWGGYHGYLHTSYSHTGKHHRSRIILPLDRPVTAKEYATLWRWAQLFDPSIDPMPKDAGRFWYVPSRHPEGDYWWCELGGALLEVGPILEEYKPHPVRRFHSRGFPQVGSVVDRARAYLARIPGAISGEGGHLQTFKVALALVRGFELEESTAFDLLSEWNATCSPAWSQKELAHKIDSAVNARIDSGYLVDSDRYERQA